VTDLPVGKSHTDQTAAKRRGADPTPWPAELMHREDCAWRFGMNAECDCGKDNEEALSDA
jgi:hypothetical protein